MQLTLRLFFFCARKKGTSTVEKALSCSALLCRVLLSENNVACEEISSFSGMPAQPIRHVNRPSLTRPLLSAEVDGIFDMTELTVAISPSSS